MNATHVLAHSQLPIRALRLAAFWAELDSRLGQGQVVVHSPGARDYRLGSIELRVRAAGGTLSAVWAAASALLPPRHRVDLIQTAQAWVASLASLERTPELGYACLDALSALLSAGFETVHLSRGDSGLPVDRHEETPGEVENNSVVGEVLCA